MPNWPRPCGGCGSAYGYSYAGLGEIVAWIIGWDLILEYGVATSAVAIGWSGYVDNALAAVGLSLPTFLTQGPTGGRAAESAGRADRADPGGTPEPRGARERALQCDHGGGQAHRHRHLHRGRGVPCPAGQLESLHALWLERGHAAARP
ncbi:MAG: hypothetical protein MZV65_00510 [Chromatiales bacterium]|nr:hypothetical protein [Chromatiales bacterium]